ncbi:hypothetical protein K1719_036711 [Acacia pycnantha]|nr:hypothetical protein K1719_036711 [Acacia pycnantha]
MGSVLRVEDMAMSKAMKATLLCVVLVLSVMTTTVVGGGDHEDEKDMHYYEKGGGGGHDGFSIKTDHKPVNPYNRGCSRITRCRDGSRKLL